MKDLIEEIDSRIKNPLFGYYFVALMAINWEVLFYLVVDKSSAAERITYFNNGSDFSTLFIYPFSVAVIYAVAYPWLSFLLMNLITKPTELRNTLQAQSEHKLIIKKKELENAREELLVSAEEELIDRAKRDTKLEDIGSEEVREKLKKEIEELRRERDRFKEDPEYRVTPDDEKIDDDQLGILRLIAKHGGEMAEEYIIDTSKYDKVKTEYYLEDLGDNGYLSRYFDQPAGDYVYSLTTKSKKIMVEHGYVK